MTATHSSAFGLDLRLHFPVPGLPTRRAHPSSPRVALRAVDQAQLATLWSGQIADPVWETLLAPGARYVLLRGAAGDHLVIYPSAPSFHLSPDGATLSCVCPEERDPDWTRTLLDTVLWTVALLRGVALLHAGAVLSPTGVVAIVGAQGAGKSSLVAQLLGDGWSLFTDDILAYGLEPDRTLTHPGPALMNLTIDSPVTPRPQSVGRILHRFDEHPGSKEAWVELDRSSPDPAPLRVLVLLRRGGEAVGVKTDAMIDPLLRVLPHTLAFRALPGAQRARFEAASDLVQRVPVLDVSAGDDVAPSAVAAAIRSQLDQAADQQAFSD